MGGMLGRGEGGGAGRSREGFRDAATSPRSPGHGHSLPATDAHSTEGTTQVRRTPNQCHQGAPHDPFQVAVPRICSGGSRRGPDSRLWSGPPPHLLPAAGLALGRGQAP